MHNESIQEKKKKESEGQSSENTSNANEEDTEEQVITLLSLNMEDMRQAKNQVTHFISINSYIVVRGKSSIYAELYIYAQCRLLQVLLQRDQ